MFKRLRRHIIPSPAALTFVWLGLGIFIVTSTFSTLIGIADRDIQLSLIGLAVFSFPGLALMLVIAALRESRAAPRVIRGVV